MNKSIALKNMKSTSDNLPRSVVSAAGSLKARNIEYSLDKY